MNNFRAHADSRDIEKIDGLLKAGLAITNTMLVMEMELKEPNHLEGDFKIKAEIYDSSDLSEYLAANAKGFGIQDPVEMIEEELNNKNSCIYVVRQRKRIVSSVTAWDIDDECMATENIFTIPSYRNRHFASELLEYVLETGRLRGMKRARLTVYGDDCEALAMYYKFGFKVTKVLQEFGEI